jgi:hypothetical protein
MTDLAFVCAAESNNVERHGDNKRVRANSGCRKSILKFDMIVGQDFAEITGSKARAETRSRRARRPDSSLHAADG